MASTPSVAFSKVARNAPPRFRLGAELVMTNAWRASRSVSISDSSSGPANRKNVGKSCLAFVATAAGSGAWESASTAAEIAAPPPRLNCEPCQDTPELRKSSPAAKPGPTAAASMPPLKPGFGKGAGARNGGRPRWRDSDEVRPR